LAPRARFELATLRLTAVNLISSQVAGAELNRGKSASSDQTGLVRFSFSFLLLFAFCSFSRRSYDTYMTPQRGHGPLPHVERRYPRDHGLNPYPDRSRRSGCLFAKIFWSVLVLPRYTKFLRQPLNVLARFEAFDSHSAEYFRVPPPSSVRHL